MNLIKRKVLLTILYSAFCFNASATDSVSKKAKGEAPLVHQIFTQLPKTLSLKGNALPFENYQAQLHKYFEQRFYPFLNFNAI